MAATTSLLLVLRYALCYQAPLRRLPQVPHIRHIHRPCLPPTRRINPLGDVGSKSIEARTIDFAVFIVQVFVNFLLMNAMACIYPPHYSARKAKVAGVV